MTYTYWNISNNDNMSKNNLYVMPFNYLILRTNIPACIPKKMFKLSIFIIKSYNGTILYNPAKLMHSLLIEHHFLVSIPSRAYSIYQGHESRNSFHYFMITTAFGLEG